MEEHAVFTGIYWRLAGATAAAVGALLLLWAARLHVFSRWPLPPGPRKALDLVRAGRAVLVGGALIGVGVGVLLHVKWLVVLALIIGGQELLETSVIAAALRDEERRCADAALAEKGTVPFSPAAG